MVSFGVQNPDSGAAHSLLGVCDASEVSQNSGVVTYNIEILCRVLSKLDKPTLAANRHSTTLALKCVPAVADFFISTYI